MAEINNIVGPHTGDTQWNCVRQGLVGTRTTELQRSPQSEVRGDILLAVTPNEGQGIIENSPCLPASNSTQPVVDFNGTWSLHCKLSWSQTSGCAQIQRVLSVLADLLPFSISALGIRYQVAVPGGTDAGGDGGCIRSL